ncbi:MAG TPA: ATP-binding protein [Actinomycetota bacterium]
MRKRALGIRSRVTLAATAVVAVVIVTVGAGITMFVSASLTDLVRDAVEDRLAAMVATAPRGGVIEVTDPSEEFVQILDGGVLVATSAGAEGSVVANPAPGDAVVVGEIPGGDGRFLALSAALPDGRRVVVGRSLSDADEATTAVVRALVLSLPVVLAAVAAITWRIVGRTLHPVEAIRAEAERISSDALDRRVPVPPGDDEIARLAGTLNEMLDRLHRWRDRQRRFVADASHELRSPIAAIRQHAEVAREHPGQTDTDELASLVLLEDDRLAHLVDDLLVLARADEGASVSAVEVDLDDVVLAEAARLRGEGSAVDTSGVGAGRVMGNPTQLERALRNLGENAARHARRRVALGVATRDRQVVVIVDDDGPGIREEDRSHAFARFVRLDEGRARHEGGSGLGLAIVQEIVRAHGGEVALAASSLGGLRVEIRLPAADGGAFRSATGPAVTMDG